MNDTEDLMLRLRKEFLDEATHLLDECEEAFLHLEDSATRGEELAAIFRAMHTMKGSGGVVGLTDLVTVAHIVEDCLSVLRDTPAKLTPAIITLLLRSCDALRIRVVAFKDGRDDEPWDVTDLSVELHAAAVELRGTVPALPNQAPAILGFHLFDEEDAAKPKVTPVAKTPCTPTPAGVPAAAKKRAEQLSGSVKIDASRIESVLDLVGELVVIKSQLMNKADSYGEDAQLTGIVALLDKTVRELQDKTLAMRMTPLKPLFVKLERLARDLSLKINKDVEFRVAGEDTEIDRTMVEVVADPLLHLVRNALDHGFEATADRLASGKSPQGHLTLAASQRGSTIELRVEDDGRGIDCARVVAKAVERGLLPPGADAGRMAERDVFELLMKPGFSTAEQVSDISGRGVGLDVVKTNIEKLRGSITVESRPGKGTTFTISIPLTASIRDGMIVEVDGFPYVLPMDRIRELVKVRAAEISTLSASQSVLHVHGRVLPWIDLSTFVQGKGNATDRLATREVSGLFVVIEQSNHWLALRVDEVVGQMQVVMKPLDRDLDAACGVTGAAVLGDGRVALVLDTEGLCRWAKVSQLAA